MKKLMSVLDNLNLNTKQKENLINVLNDHIEEKINHSPKIVTLDIEDSKRSDGEYITTINNIHPQTVVGNIYMEGTIDFSFFDDFYKELKDNIVFIKFKTGDATYYSVADINLFYDDATGDGIIEAKIHMDGEQYTFAFVK